jgi:hypothetical protein
MTRGLPTCTTSIDSSSLIGADSRGASGGPWTDHAGKRESPPEVGPQAFSTMRAMRHGFAADLGIVVAAAIVGTLVAALLGAANLGTALTFGQIAFAAALVWVLLKR